MAGLKRIRKNDDVIVIAGTQTADDAAAWIRLIDCDCCSQLPATGRHFEEAAA